MDVNSATKPTSRVFRSLPFMGVIRVNNEAAAVGYRMGDPAWSNLGQGQPEVGEIEGAPPRISRLEIDPADHAYGPVEGTLELREAIASHYNRLYRAGKSSKYSAQNIAVCCGGRLALTRVAAAMGFLRLGYFTPDYTAYEDLLSTFTRIEPVRIALSAADRFRINRPDLQNRIEVDRLDAVLLSNPCNPTGTVIRGKELAGWIGTFRRGSSTLLLDEFYSHYFYGEPAGPVSAAREIEDVNKDPVVLFDGLTKCFRYPGWRLGWVVAPRDTIQTITAAGSFLDGGPSRPMQRAALRVLEADRADQETDAVRRLFSVKQRITIDRLSELGVTFDHGPEGTFYAWGNIARLPPPLNSGVHFMREAFKHRVLTVPGEFFDVNPSACSRPEVRSWSDYVRFSFGPSRENLEAGLGRLAEMIRKAGS